MMSRARHSPGGRTLAAVLLLLLAACFGTPFERSNILDTEANGRIEVSGVPDSTFSRTETFTAIAKWNRDIPKGIDGVTFESVPSGYLDYQGNGVFAAGNSVNLVATPVRVRAYVLDPEISPIGEKLIWVRQRPRSLQFFCTPSQNCAAVGVGGMRQLDIVLRDSLGYDVLHPPTAFRFGTVVTRNSLVAVVDSRPFPNNVNVRAFGPGTTWIVLSGEGLADSVQIQVVP